MKWQLSLVLFICSIAVAVLFLMPPAAFGLSILGTFKDPETWTLLTLVVVILMLSGCMSASGALDSLALSIQRIVRDSRVTMGILPALIGFLPMPGGALFSAPMLDGLEEEAGLTPESKTFINYWFRHVWEYSFPLYPGVLLTSTILHISSTKLMLFQFPMSLVAIVAGTIFGLFRLPRAKIKSDGSGKILKDFLAFLWAFWPVLFIIFGIFAIPWSRFIPWKNFEPLTLVLPVTLLLFGLPRLGARGFVKAILSEFDFRLPLTVISVLVFKDVIGNSGAAGDLGATLQRIGIPPIALMIFLPALIGYLTGLTPSFVSVAFPLLLVFFGSPPDLSKVQLAYTAGLLGVMLSPVHLCLVLTVDYFKADLNKVFRMLYPPVLTIITASLLYYFLTKH